MTRLQAAGLAGQPDRAEPRHAVSAGQQRNDAFLRFSLAGLRVLNCSTSLVVLIARFGHYRLPGAVAATYAGVVGWSVWLFGWGTRGRMVTTRLALVDLATACVALLVVGLLAPASSAADWMNWSFAYGLAVVLVAGAVYRPVPALGAAVLLSAVYLLGVAPAVTSGQASLTNAIGNVCSFVAFVLFALAVSRHLRRTAAELDTALGRALDAEAERARMAERARQYRTLHDTVLATLTAIARGGLDHRSPAVRLRCLREADYLRRLIENEAPSERTGLDAALRGAVERAAELGLRVSYAKGSLPDALPEDVVGAVAGATEEALENVRRHAGVTAARLTATYTEGVLVVRVVDQGRGFDPATTPARLGIAESIEARVRDAGGSGRVESRPGEGTWVELRWPAR